DRSSLRRLAQRVLQGRHAHQHLLHGKIIWRSAIARSRQTVSGFNRISSPASEAGLKAPTDAGPGLFALDVMAAGRLVQKKELLLSRFPDQGHRTIGKKRQVLECASPLALLNLLLAWMKFESLARAKTPGDWC